MPSFTKSPPELIKRFASVADAFPDAERRQMFGYPCLFVGGSMVTGLFDESWFVRLGEPERSELLAMDGAGPFAPMPGRPISGYFVLPESVLVAEPDLQAWVGRALAFGRSLPPKVPGARAAKAAKPRRKPA